MFVVGRVFFLVYRRPNSLIYSRKISVCIKASAYFCNFKHMGIRNGLFVDVFATNYDITIGLITTAREKGIRIPEQLDIIGFDCPEVCGMMNPPMPVVHQPEAEIGQKAAGYLIERLSGFDGEARTTRLACTLVPD